MTSEPYSFLKTRWPLLAVLLVFICFKIPQLNYPFYIDEGWVYAPAIKTMALHGPSLMPDAIPPDLSRGHPLMFHFLCAVWIRCFGGSNFAIHSFPFVISIIFLIALFEGCLRLFGHRTAVIVILLVATRVIFFVQSSFAYPEVMLAMFAFLSIYFYARDKLALTSLSLFMLFFTKEGGLIFGAVIAADAAIRLFGRSEPLGRRLARTIAILLPAALTACFFIIQHKELGWYIFPEHSGLIKTQWVDYYLMFKRALYWSFRGDKAMCVLALFAVLLSAVPAVKYKNPYYLFLILPALFVYRQAEWEPLTVGRAKIWMALYLVCFSAPAWLLRQLNTAAEAPYRKFIILSTAGGMSFVLYAALTQVAYRYQIVVIILVLIFLAVCMDLFISAAGNKAFYGTVAAVLLIGAFGFYTNDRAEDTQLDAYKVMKVQMGELAYLEKEKAYDKEIAYGCPWEQIRFTDTMEGYLSSGRTFTHLVVFPIGPGAEYATFTNIWGEEKNYPAEIKAHPEFHLAYRVQDGKWWAEVYKRVMPPAISAY